MIETLDRKQVAQRLNDHFSWSAGLAIADWYDDWENETGYQFEFDYVLICNTWKEFANSTELIQAYGYVLNDDWSSETDDDCAEAIIEYLEQDGITVIDLPDGYLVKQD